MVWVIVFVVEMLFVCEVLVDSCIMKGGGVVGVVILGVVGVEVV